jgi:cobalt transporter subunit CbtA
MIGRVLLAALLSGIAAGLIFGMVQHRQLTPLILEAEVFETAGHNHVDGHDHKTPEPHIHDTENTTNADQVQTQNNEIDSTPQPFQRSSLTVATTALAGAGWAAILAGLATLLNLSLTGRNGLVWGLCGFVAVALAPAAGLPPELPGMPAADLTLRLTWWLGTIICTAGALYIALVRREAWALPVAIGLALVPHIIGAPLPPSTETAVPAHLIQRFVAMSLAANGLFWCLIGTFLGLALDHVNKEPQKETRA